MSLMKESDFQTRFGAWLRTSGQGYFCKSGFAFELKLVRGKDKRLPFQKVAAHQEAALEAVEGGGLYFKLSDFAPGLKPFDCVWMKGGRGYLVVGYETGRGQTSPGERGGRIEAVIVCIGAWLALKAAEVAKGRRSVRREDLEAVAERVEWM